MRKSILLFIIFHIFMLMDINAKEINGIDSSLLEKFLSQIYNELKCPRYPSYTVTPKREGRACLISLKLNYEKNNQIVFLFDTSVDDNRYLKNFDEKSPEEKELALFNLLQKIAIYSGISPIQGSDEYVGIIQITTLNHVVNNESLSEEKKIRDFVKNNSVIGLSLVENLIPMHMAFLDINDDMHFKSGIGVSLSDFKMKSSKNSN